MDVEIRHASLSSGSAKELIASLNAELSAVYPEPGATHFRLDPEEVAEGAGAFLIAWCREVPIGCGAVRLIDADRAEIKRMYVERARRGTGVGALLLTALEAEARRLGAARVVLETGTRQTEAMELYTSRGYYEIPLFGDYLGSDLSICLEKLLG